jgi:hypothetical protein
LFTKHPSTAFLTSAKSLLFVYFFTGLKDGIDTMEATGLLLHTFQQDGWQKLLRKSHLFSCLLVVILISAG